MLKDLVTIVHNDKDSVILKVKEDKEFDLICLGCFNGGESMFRLTKDSSHNGNHTCTMWFKKGGSVDWCWGTSTTLVGDNLRKAGKMVQETIELGFGIVTEGKNIVNTLGCIDYSSTPKQIRVSYWNNVPIDLCVRDGVNDTFIGRFKDYMALNSKLGEYGYKITEIERGYSAQTGCNVDIFALFT